MRDVLRVWKTLILAHVLRSQSVLTLKAMKHRIVQEGLAWLRTVASAAIYATLLITFVGQVARVQGTSMAPTLEDQDRLIVNKLAYRLADPQVGDIVMHYYPLKPERTFVKRVIAQAGDHVRIVDGRVFRNNVLLDDGFVPAEYRGHSDWGPQVVPEGQSTSSWATIAPTAPTAVTGASCPRNTSPAKCRCGGGRWGTRGCFERASGRRRRVLIRRGRRASKSRRASPGARAGRAAARCWASPARR